MTEEEKRVLHNESLFRIAQRDEECGWCAYPFDAGDNAYTDQKNDVICCSIACLTKALA